MVDCWRVVCFPARHNRLPSRHFYYDIFFFWRTWSVLILCIMMFRMLVNFRGFFSTDVCDNDSDCLPGYYCCKGTVWCCPYGSKCTGTETCEVNSFFRFVPDLWMISQWLVSTSYHMFIVALNQLITSNSCI